MEKGNLSNDFFSYKNYHRFTDTNYILVVKDEEFPDKNVISILHKDNQTISDIDEYDMGSRILATPNKMKPEVSPLGERFSLNQLLKISEGNIIYNNRWEENSKYPKVITYHTNINPLKENEIIEIFEGKIDEPKSRFELKDPALNTLITDVYLGTSNCFFITEDNNKMTGPFITTKKDSSGQFIIEKSFWKTFGEYDLDNQSHISFTINEIHRNIYIPGYNNLSSPHKIDFISDEDLLDHFKFKITKSSHEFNPETLNLFIDYIHKATSTISIEENNTRNKRLLKLIQKAENSIISNIDFTQSIPQIGIIKSEIQKLLDRKLQLTSEINKSTEDKEKLDQDLFNLQNEIEKTRSDLENINQLKEQELQNKKSELDQQIKDLELEKMQLSESIDNKRKELSNNLSEIIENIEKKKIIEKELDNSIESLKGSFVDAQRNAQVQLNELIQHKKYFDFLSGRDIATYEIKHNDSFLDLRTKDYKYDDYVSFRNKILEIFEKNNRRLESHFIDNLLISIHQNILTIFAGLPGTGKTSLAKLLVNILAPSQKIREVSVSRGWTSQKDLIGFLNPLTRKFHPSSTDVYSLLKQLDYERKNNIYMDSTLAYIILDEANLSPLEHYWSIFYNLTDNKAHNDNYLKINLGQHENIEYANNLRFIGTINYDQTTEELSPRVIDRANIIRMYPKSFDIDSITFNDIQNVCLTFKQCRDFFELLDFSDKPYTIALENEQELIYKEVKKRFNNLKLYISPRVEIAIKRYCNVAKKYMHEENKPLDYSIAQRLLPLINCQGANTKQKLKDLLSYLREQNLEISYKILSDIIQVGEEGEIFEDQFNYFLTLSHA